jgi:hypothetical protein
MRTAENVIKELSEREDGTPLAAILAGEAALFYAVNVSNRAEVVHVVAHNEVEALRDYYDYTDIRIFVMSRYTNDPTWDSAT